MTQRENQALYFAQLGQHEGAGIGHVVGVADAENVAAAVKIANRCGVLRARRPYRPGAAGCCLLALALHRTHLMTSYLVEAHPSQIPTNEKYRESYSFAKFGNKSPGKPRHL